MGACMCVCVCASVFAQTHACVRARAHVFICVGVSVKLIFFKFAVNYLAQLDGQQDNVSSSSYGVGVAALYGSMVGR